MKKMSVSLCAAFLAVTAGTASAEPVRGVVELFTSQSCSSCPPADKIFGQVIRDDGVLGLAFHVDYWNYLDWRDTFSSADSTRRQREYAASLHSPQVYTPQLIVNGTHVVSAGSPEKLSKMINEVGNGLTVPVSADLENGRLLVKAGTGIGEANLLLAIFDESETVKVKRGENAGKEITYHNSVTGLRTIGMWKGKALEVELPRKEYLTKAGQGCAVLLQRVTPEGTPGEIIGAAMVTGTGS